MYCKCSKKNNGFRRRDFGSYRVLRQMTTGDAIIASLLVLQALIQDGCSLADAVAPMEKYPQALINISVDKSHNGSMPKLTPEIEHIVDQARKALDKEGRVLIRPSGTEPMLRIMLNRTPKIRADYGLIALLRLRANICPATSNAISR